MINWQTYYNLLHHPVLMYQSPTENNSGGYYLINVNGDAIPFMDENGTIDGSGNEGSDYYLMFQQTYAAEGLRQANAYADSQNVIYVSDVNRPYYAGITYTRGGNGTIESFFTIQYGRGYEYIDPVTQNHFWIVTGARAAPFDWGLARDGGIMQRLIIGGIIAGFTMGAGMAIGAVGGELSAGVAAEATAGETAATIVSETAGSSVVAETVATEITSDVVAETATGFVTSNEPIYLDYIGDAAGNGFTNVPVLTDTQLSNLGITATQAAEIYGTGLPVTNFGLPDATETAVKKVLQDTAKKLASNAVRSMVSTVSKNIAPPGQRINPDTGLLQPVAQGDSLLAIALIGIAALSFFS
jgi:hypothetical protein